MRQRDSVSNGIRNTAAKCWQFVKCFLLSNYEGLRRQSAGGMQPNLNLGLVKRIAISPPPLAEQEHIVAEVERRLSVVTATEAQLDAELRRAAQLRQAILRRAFAGELEPQDPANEPAKLPM
jgi:type I restriction enzyme S subunit